MSQMNPTDHKRYLWWQLADANIDHDRLEELERDAKEVRNEIWKQMYYWDDWTCMEIGKMYGFSEATVYRVIATGEPLEPEIDEAVHLWVDMEAGIHIAKCGVRVPAVEDGEYTKRITGLTECVTCDKCKEEEE